MKTHVRIFAVPAVIVLVLAGSALLADDGQGWLNNSLTFKIDSRFSLKFANERRCNEVTYTDPYLLNWQGGIVYNLSKKLYVSFMYKREDTKKTTYVQHENRYNLETGWKTSLSKKTVFDIRFRIEIREYEEGKAEDHLRVRLRLRIKSKMKVGQLEVEPFIALEPFADTRTDDLNQYRFYAGFIFPMGKNVGFVVNYIRQGTKNKESLNILNTGFEFKF
jgi:hypothetical protein